MVIIKGEGGIKGSQGGRRRNAEGYQPELKVAVKMRIVFVCYFLSEQKTVRLIPLVVVRGNGGRRFN